MQVPLWVHEIAACFWEAAGSPEPFPRTLREPVHRSPFELTIKEIPGLSTTVAERYLARFGPVWACAGPHRAVRACLAARDGAGFILLDASDTPAERVFSLAHELAHFLGHYWWPRQRASRQFGCRAAEVFDGRRPATPAERLRALLANVPLGLHMHLMERGPRREILDDRVARAEEEADRIAYELLAPVEAVWTASKAVPGAEFRADRLATVLAGVFSLPSAQAQNYSHLLLPSAPPDPLIQRLRRNP